MSEAAQRSILLEAVKAADRAGYQPKAWDTSMDGYWADCVDSKIQKHQGTRSI